MYILQNRTIWQHMRHFMTVMVSNARILIMISKPILPLLETCLGLMWTLVFFKSNILQPCSKFSRINLDDHCSFFSCFDYSWVISSGITCNPCCHLKLDNNKRGNQSVVFFSPSHSFARSFIRIFAYTFKLSGRARNWFNWIQNLVDFLFTFNF